MAQHKRKRGFGCLKTLFFLVGLVFVFGIVLSLLPDSESDDLPTSTQAVAVERAVVTSLDVDAIELDPTVAPADIVSVTLEPASSPTSSPTSVPTPTSTFTPIPPTSTPTNPPPTSTPLPTNKPVAASSDFNGLNEKSTTIGLPTATSIAERSENNPLGQPGKVTRVIDGDTIEVQIDGEPFRVRYILIDTPEKGQYYFNEATGANRALVGGRTVYLQRDVSETDRYGRLLRYVYLADGTFVNAELVRQGYATMATYPPDVTKEAEIRETQREAIEAGAGLWAAEYAEPIPVANSGANLRSGPGTDYPVQGGVPVGEELSIVYTNPAGDWYQLDSGLWIAAFLVDNTPENPPVARNISPPPQPPQVQVEAPTAAPAPVRSEPVQAVVCECGGNFYNCSDFGSHSQAQACFEYCRSIGRGDIHRLDRDRDGSACESLP